FIFQLRKLNFRLSDLSTSIKNLHICDFSGIQNNLGKSKIFHPSIYINSDMVVSIDALPYLSKITFDIINALEGKIKKCLILDLDNTLWGGIIGDDGLENIQIGGLGIGKAFTEFQHWLKELKNRGIILAVCSKNNYDIACEPFEKHPDMVLRNEDISVFVANWENKASNIRHIQQILNIGFDSMVFLDDNPFERNMVRENINGITVPELPEDPSDYLEFLYSLNLFETAGISKEDTERTKQYQTEALRSQYQKSFVDEDDFLKNLSMISKVEGFTAFNTPRVAQLSQRSNQFNLRTVRYSESEISTMSNSKATHPFAFHLEDKFGDHGLISLIILKEKEDEILFIETWLMSCRVLKRGMENFVLNTIAEYAVKNGFLFLEGEYIPTAKNEMVKDHYLNLGFEPKENFWQLNLEKYNYKKSFIQIKSEYVKRNYSTASN
ncbi:MAG: HAD-IIIC family phosphatase, partial [Bacteroidota bacterium]